ncbi:MAG TPA: hypothetical protein VMW07_02480 [Gallionella sp.]|jgi:hypothetical protein|nr:hypothetical protein [Gallionella sp.]
MEEARIRIFLDDVREPIADYEPPAQVAINTRLLADGEHRLRIEAHDRHGNIGIREVPFQVRNGPGITLTGLHPGAVVRDTINFTVNAFGAEDPFEPRRAESPSPIPLWLWVLSLVIAAWAMWYVTTLWNPPPDFLKTPTYAVPMSERQ